jgi:hypothetical protein
MLDFVMIDLSALRVGCTHELIGVFGWRNNGAGIIVFHRDA